MANPTGDEGQGTRNLDAQVDLANQVNHAGQSGGASAALGDHVLCAKCRYNLYGLQSDARCPECGTPIAETLSSETVHRLGLETVHAIALGLRRLSASVWIAMGIVVLNILNAIIVSPVSYSTNDWIRVIIFGICTLCGWFWWRLFLRGVRSLTDGYRPDGKGRQSAFIARIAAIASVLIPVAIAMLTLLFLLQLLNHYGYANNLVIALAKTFPSISWDDLLVRLSVGLELAGIIAAGLSLAFSAGRLVLMGEKVISRRLRRVLSLSSAGVSLSCVLGGLVGLTLFAGDKIPSRWGPIDPQLLVMAGLMAAAITLGLFSLTLCWTLNRARKLAMAVYRQRLSYAQA